MSENSLSVLFGAMADTPYSSESDEDSSRMSEKQKEAFRKFVCENFKSDIHCIRCFYHFYLGILTIVSNRAAFNISFYNSSFNVYTELYHRFENRRPMRTLNAFMEDSFHFYEKLENLLQISNLEKCSTFSLYAPIIYDRQYRCWVNCSMIKRKICTGRKHNHFDSEYPKIEEYLL
ncbi:unnamed protein product [Orchesella dallaii]|uniref:Uncharacterized protein n=1 Tax=Orchesella dallaii TaxID=48710 RepID=A0ABP1RIN9_9HEXA